MSEIFESVKNLAKEFFEKDLLAVTERVFDEIGDISVIIRCESFEDWRAKVKAFKEVLKKRIGEEVLGKVVVVCLEGLR